MHRACVLLAILDSTIETLIHFDQSRALRHQHSRSSDWITGDHPHTGSPAQRQPPISRPDPLTIHVQISNCDVPFSLDNHKKTWRKERTDSSTTCIRTTLQARPWCLFPNTQRLLRTERKEKHTESSELERDVSMHADDKNYMEHKEI